MSDIKTDQTYVEIRAVAVPKLGFGTWQLVGSGCRSAVCDALEMGYRQLDTARIYENEVAVGAGMHDSGVAREQIWLTTKVWMEDLAPKRLRAALEASLRELRTDYVDLLLIHWPNPEVPLEDSLRTMAALREEDKIRELGVSNFPSGLFQQALDQAPVFCNQVEYHPFLTQTNVLALARQHDVLVTAYSPLAHGKAFSDPILAAIGAKYGKTGSQVALRWLIDQPSVSAIPKASSHDHRQANFDIWDFELTDSERSQIDALPKDQRDVEPEWAPDWDN